MTILIWIIGIHAKKYLRSVGTTIWAFASDHTEVLVVLLQDSPQQHAGHLQVSDSCAKVLQDGADMESRLAEHFGDTLPDKRRECGHCTYCETHAAVKPLEPRTVPWDPATFNLVLKAVPDRDDARYLARLGTFAVSHS